MCAIDRGFFNLAVLNAPMAQVARAFAALPHPVLAHPAPLVFPLQRYRAEAGDPPLILWSPLCAPELTAFMPCTSSGDYFVTSYARERFGLSFISVRSTAPDHSNPVNEFAIHAGKETKAFRWVRAMAGELHWEFHAEGEPLPFENIQAYKARRIRDRLTREMLLTYMEYWGAPVKNADFWRSAADAMTLVRTRPGQ